MDVGKFRLGGELSDIDIVIDDNHLQLHRFPLYTRSNFFLKEFAKLGAQRTITLPNFPGGIDVFTIIADFCYNISVSITVDNVVGLRCGAKYLEMYGSGNLYEKTGVIIEELSRNARKGKDIVLLIKLVSNIANYQMYETTNHALEQCVTALAQYWSKCQYGTSAIDEMRQPEILSIFFQMQFDFYVSLLKMLKEKCTNADVLDVLVSEYILNELDSDITVNGHMNGDVEIPTKDTETINDDEQDTDSTSSEHVPVFTEEKLKKVQTLLNDIQPNISRNTATKWLKPLLDAYSKVDGSDAMLGSIAASMVNQVDADSISRMGEQTLVSFAERVEPESLSDKTKVTITDNLVKRVDADQLNADAFMKIIRKLKLHEASCQDNLLYIISKLNNNPESFEETDLTECLAMVDMKKCTVKALRNAQQTDAIPAQFVLNAALDLCEVLQEKNDVAAKIIQEQEKEISTLTLNSYGMLRIDISPPRTPKRIRASSHNNLYTSPTRGETRNGTRSSPTAGLTRALDSWPDQTATHSVTSHQDSNLKLSEFLRKQRQSKLWK